MLTEVKFDNSHYFVDEQYRKQGEYKLFYNNRRIWTYSEYLDDKLHGEYCTWHESGEISENSFFKNGKRHGEYKKWRSNGDVLMHCFYIDGECIPFNILPYPSTPEERMLFKLKYDIRLLPVEDVC